MFPVVVFKVFVVLILAIEGDKYHLMSVSISSHVNIILFYWKRYFFKKNIQTGIKLFIQPTHYRKYNLDFLTVMIAIQQGIFK